jgi:hypothetical protein
VDIVAGDEEISLVEYGIPGKVIHTPGYSLGSVSVLLENGEAFVGDLAMNMVPLRLKPGLPIFGDSLSIVKNSIVNGCKDSLSNAWQTFLGGDLIQIVGTKYILLSLPPGYHINLLDRKF